MQRPKQKAFSFFTPELVLARWSQDRQAKPQASPAMATLKTRPGSKPSPSSGSRRCCGVCGNLVKRDEQMTFCIKPCENATVGTCASCGIFADGAQRCKQCYTAPKKVTLKAGTLPSKSILTPAPYPAIGVQSQGSQSGPTDTHNTYGGPRMSA